MYTTIYSFYVVELMRTGVSPTNAAKAALQRIEAKYPKFSGALVATNKDGSYGK